LSGATPAERVAVVTGATSGIGRAIAEGLARQGFRTVVVGRGAGRAESVSAEIARESQNPRVDWLSVDDLALQSVTRALGAELRRRYPAIHVLVNNAGAFFAQREVTTEGVERTFALNVLAPLALTLDLAPALRAAAPARVVNVASAAHVGAHVPLNDLESQDHYRGFRTYSRSKLELILLTRELARRFSGTGVTVTAVHPGFVSSGFGMNNRGAARAAMWVASRLFGKRPQRGARTPLMAASDPQFENATGVYLSGERIVAGSAPSRDMRMARRLYDACAVYLRIPTPPESTGGPVAPG
jgi:NAD(P)-dependent dehydrogenase (short-subunit alcohol dehydrogenase family)